MFCTVLYTNNIFPSILSKFIELMPGETLFQFLKNRNLESYFAKFHEQGALYLKDVLDGVEKDVLTQDIGMTPLEANKFLKMIEEHKVRFMLYVLNNKLMQ